MLKRALCGDNAAAADQALAGSDDELAGDIAEGERLHRNDDDGETRGDRFAADSFGFRSMRDDELPCGAVAGRVATIGTLAEASSRSTFPRPPAAPDRSRDDED